MIYPFTGKFFISSQASIFLKQVYRRFYFYLLSRTFITGSSCPEVLYRREIFKKYAKFRGKHLRRSLFYNKDVSWRPAMLFTKEIPAQMFSCEFCEVTRILWDSCLCTGFCTDTSTGIFLNIFAAKFKLKRQCSWFA